MWYDPFLKCSNCTSGHENRHCLWKPRIHYMLQVTDTVRILKQITHPSLCNQFNIILPYIRISIPSYIFISGFFTKIVSIS